MLASLSCYDTDDRFRRGHCRWLPVDCRRRRPWTCQPVLLWSCICPDHYSVRKEILILFVCVLTGCGPKIREMTTARLLRSCLFLAILYLSSRFVFYHGVAAGGHDSTRRARSTRSPWSIRRYDAEYGALERYDTVGYRQSSRPCPLNSLKLHPFPIARGFYTNVPFPTARGIPTNP